MSAPSTNRFEMVLSKLKGVRRRGRKATACCPAHADRKPSLSVAIDTDGRVLLNCFAGCGLPDILDELDLNESDLDPSIEAIYRYLDADGTLLYEKVRRAGKKFSFRRPKLGGGYAYSLGEGPRVLYNLPFIVSQKEKAAAAGQQPVVVLVEGEKDADRLTECCVLATTTALGAKSPWIPSYTAALAGFRVIVLPDNDEPGRAYAERAANHLSSAGVDVRVVALDGLLEHGDVSDWLAAGGTVERLRDLAESAQRWQPTKQSASATAGESNYFETSEGIFARMHGRDGDESVRLTNFSARVIEDVLFDDGAEKTRRFTLHSPRFPHSVQILATDFQNLGWVSDLGGARAIVRSGHGLRSKVPEAILELSQDDLVERTVYSHLGWRQIDGIYVYLHASGAIGPSGPVDNIQVETEGRLRDCALPPVVDIVRAVRASLRLLDVAPPRVTYPLLSAIYRAPLMEAVPATCAVFITGETGSRKSAITGIAQAHFGAAFADGKTFLANWSSTGNSIERTAFLAKDIICTVDDFVLTGTMTDMQRIKRTAEQVFRGVGNKAGRGRMRADASMRPEMYPRGLVLASGEVIPEGKSLGARLLVIELGPNDVKNDVLSMLQGDAGAGLLTQAMAGYVQFLAPQIQRLKQTLLEEQNRLRASVAANHARTSENTAQFYIGLKTFLDFAVGCGAIDFQTKEGHLERGWQVFLEQAAIQDRHVKSEDPIEHFLALLKTVLVSANRGHLRTRQNDRPARATSFGWQRIERERRGDDGQPISYTEWRAGGDLLGWIDGDDLYLESHASYAAIKKLATDNNLSMPVPVHQLGKRLKERGLLVSTRAENENKAQVTVSGRTITTVFHLSATVAIGVADDETEDQPQPDADGGDEEDDVPF